MKENRHSGETCASCLAWDELDEKCNATGEENKGACLPACEEITSSLECRKVRAVERKADALEHIGDILCSLVDATLGRKPVCDVDEDDGEASDAIDQDN